MSHLWRSNLISKQNIVRKYSHLTTEYKYVTTPIFYINAAPHIGHLYTALIADSLVRFNSMQGHTVLLNTGTDEHGTKVQQAAIASNKDIINYCNGMSQQFVTMCNYFKIGYTNFIRTTEPNHRVAVQHFWKLLEEKKCIYKGKYSGWYCSSEEAFLSNQDLVEKQTPSGETIKVSAESGHTVKWVEEDNYKFRLSAFQDALKYWLKDEKIVQPSVFHKILCQWVESGDCMADLSISRPLSRCPWGIPTPNDTNQTIYVWLDALVNYLTSLGYPDEKFKKFWPPSVQVIGKDILKFHGIYWPAFLIAAGLEPPKTLLCHSHWTIDGEKMSKSIGNVVSPLQACDKITVEGLRYFLLRDSVPHHDSNYSTERAINIVNSELADVLGNLVYRITSKAVNPEFEIPNVQLYGKDLNSEPAKILRENMESLGDTAKQHYESFYNHHVVDAVMATLRSANTLIDHHAIWKLRKEPNNELGLIELKSVIALVLEATRISALVLYPIIPDMSTQLLNFLNIPLHSRSWKDTKPKYLSSVSTVESEEKYDLRRRVSFKKV